MNRLISIGSMQTDCFKFESHQHSFWEVSYYIKGSGVNTIGGKQYSFSEGTIICQPPEIPHMEVSERGFRNYFFAVEKMDDFNMEVPVFFDGPNRECEQLIYQMQYCFHRKEANWTMLVHTLLALFTEYLRSYIITPKMHPAVESCVQRIIENISNQEFCLADFLNTTALSANYFIRLFKHEVGMTPNEYLIDKRMDYAVRLLSSRRDFGYRIKDVARMCGYNDQYYFSRVFKQKTGLAPKIMFP
jgi:AraC-like DNA-binding protein